jgi:hypothetical protein
MAAPAPAVADTPPRAGSRRQALAALCATEIVSYGGVLRLPGAGRPDRGGNGLVEDRGDGGVLAVFAFLGAAMIIAAAPITTAIRSRSQKPAEALTVN